MAPILHIMRHGQGWHSVAEDGHSIRDPELTPKGREQCAERCASFDRQDKVRFLSVYRSSLILERFEQRWPTDEDF